MQKTHLFISLIALTLVITPVHAASALPSPSLSPSPISTSASDKEITDNLKKKIAENLDKSKEILTTSTARGYIGIVKDVIKDTVIIEDKDGKKDIKITEDTTILRSPGSTTIKSENIRIDDYIIAIGYPIDDETMTGKRLIVSADPIKAPDKSSAIGTISKIGKTSLTLKLADKDQAIGITAKTIYKSSVGTIELTDLSVGDTVIYTATVEDPEVTATIIMRTGTASIGQ
ncbi:MAG: hypothetical protein WCG44_03265 [bacterium]